MAKNAKLGLEEHVKKENPPGAPFKGPRIAHFGKKVEFLYFNQRTLINW